MTLLPPRAPPPAAYLARAPLRHPRAARSAVACAAQPHVDVAIVGGGPAGLAAAHAVLRHAPNLSVRVFEGGREYRAQGAGVLLNINGWRALEALKPSLRERLWQDSIRLQGSRQFTEAGERLESPFGGGGGGWGHEANLERYGCTLQLAAWSAIRDVLYEELPEGVVQFGSKVEAMDVREDGVAELQLADDAAGGECRVTAGAVIGADGFFSRIRERVLADGPPDFTGRLTWRGRVALARGDGGAGDWLHDNIPNGDSTCLWINPATVGKDRNAVVYPIGDGVFVFTANCPVWRLEEAGHSFEPFSAERRASVMTLQDDAQGPKGGTVLERCLAGMAGYPPELLDIIRATPEGAITEHGYYIRPVDKMPVERWGQGAVTLLGDAAHLAPPDGQGLNLALEDAAVLGLHLRAHGGAVTAEALRAYEKARIPRVKSILSYMEFQPERQALVVEDCLGEVSPQRQDVSAA